MKPTAIRRLLVQLIPMNEPLLLVGSPGIGKSDTVEYAAKQLKQDLIVTHPVVDDPTDYKGMPAVVQGGEHGGEASAQFLPFGDLWRMIEAKRPTLVFMDDIGQAPPAVQAAIMQLVLARRINGHRVSDKVTFVAATNRRQDKAAVTGLITPLLDRFTTVVTMDFDLDDWIAWGIENDMPALLLSFARFRTDLMAKFEANKDMRKSATPRSVAALGRLMNAGIDDYEVWAGAVGDGFATEFRAFYQTASEMPSRDEIYLNPTKVPVPEKPDVLYALMGSLAYGATEVTMEATTKYLERVKPEFGVLCIKDLMLRNPKLKSTRAFTQWASKNKAVFGYDNK
jgi:hypothetical protein